MKATVLEKVLLSQVERELEELGLSLGEPESALAHIRSVLDRKELSAAERQKLAEGPQALLAVRIEEALRTAVEALAGEGGGYRPPNVVLVPGGADSSAVRDTLVESLRRGDLEESSGTLVAGDTLDTLDTLVMGDGEAGGEAPDPEPRGTLVIADEKQMQDLRGDTDGVDQGTLQLPDLTQHPELDGQNLELLGAPGLAEDFERYEQTLAVDPIDPAGLERASSSRRRSGPRTLPPSRSPKDLVGTIFGGQYEIRRVIGEGGFGAVLEAFDQELLTSVAIKIVRPEVVRSRRDLDEFKEEARRVTRLKHPNIVEWKTLSETVDGTPYFVMEYLDGEELEETLKREGPLDWRRVQAILLQVLGALRAAHHLDGGGSILHLDLKPKNIFLTRNVQGEDVAKVIDFGIGQFATRRPTQSEEPGGTLSVDTLMNEAGADVRKTSTKGGITRSSGCTPEYASPEQCGHMMPGVDIQALDGRSDVYSLGVVAFQMLTGALPFEAPRSGKRREYLRLHREAEPRKLSSMGVKIPRGLARFIEQCLVKDRDRRWRDTNEAFAALDRVVHPPVGGPVVALLGSLAVALGLVVWLLLQDPPKETLVANWIDVLEREHGISETVFLGPERPSVEVRVKSGPDLTDPEILRVVQNRDSDVADPDWIVSSSGKDSVRLSRREGSKATRARLFLQTSDGSKTYSTEQVHIEYIEPEAFRIQPRIDGPSPDDVIDPAGLVLEVAVHEGPVKGIERVQLRIGERVEDVDTVNLGSVDALYKLPLDFLAGERDLEGRMRIELLDQAGGVHTKEIVVPFDGKPFEPEVTLRGVHSVASLHQIGREDPTLEVIADRKLQVRWRFERAGERAEQAPQLAILPAPAAGNPVPQVVKLTLGGDRKQSWNGRLLVEIQDLVHHKEPQRGKSSHEFALQYSAIELEVSAISLGEFGVPAEGTPPTLYLAEQSPELTFLHNSAAMWARARILDGEDVLHDTGQSNQTAVDPLVIELPFPADGPFDLEFSCGPLDLASLEARPASLERRVRVVVDTHAPTWVHQPESLADTRSTPWVPVFELEDGEFAGPVSLTYQLERVRPQEFFGPFELEPQMPGKLHLSLETPWGETKDGDWILRLEGADAAGNRLEPQVVPVTVARAGPALEVTIPRTKAGSVWTPYSQDLGHLLEVRVTDPNGVARVTAGYVARRGGEVVNDGELDLVRMAPDSDHWRADMPFDEFVSECALELSVLAEDVFGNQQPVEAYTLKLPAIVPRRPATIEVRAGDVPSSRMVLITASPSRSFTLLGRPNDADLLDQVGMGGPPMSGVEIPLEGLVDYYLDETEVRVGDFRRFLETGYMLEEHWAPGAHGPNDEERRQVLSDLEGVDPDVAVTRVTWDEAHAYARWRGMRLQSFCEWEFAVRGLNYRLSSIANPVQANVAILGRATNGPWRVTEGDDVLADAGLYNLCSNVSEWTSTPYRLPSFTEPLGPEDFPLRDPDRLGDVEKLRIVGGSFRGSNWSYAKRDWGRRNRREQDVGFRCAVAREALQEGVREGTLKVQEL